MRGFLAVTTGGAIAVMLGIGAFITADFGWLHGMWDDWSRSDRGALLYGIVCCLALGGVLGGAIDFASNHRD